MVVIEKHKIFNLIENLSNLTAPPIVPLSPADAENANKTLEVMKAAALALKDEINAFPGDMTLMTGFLNEDNDLLANITNLQNLLPNIAMGDVNKTSDSLADLRKRFDNFMVDYNGIFT
jgi:hypothetical protein